MDVRISIKKKNQSLQHARLQSFIFHARDELTVQTQLWNLPELLGRSQEYSIFLFIVQMTPWKVKAPNLMVLKIEPIRREILPLFREVWDFLPKPTFHQGLKPT